MEGNMINVESGGTLVNKTTSYARSMITTMVRNSEQFGTTNRAIRKVSEVITSSQLEQHLCNLTTLVQQLTIER